jgi:hypothetical protein
MLRRARSVLVWASLGAAVVAPKAVRAQTTAGPSITASGQVAPHRIVNGNDLGESTRSANLNPLGVNYSDCIQDMTLRFAVNVSGFTGADSLQVWASKSSDCTSTADRMVGMPPACWLLNQGDTGLVQQSAAARNYDVRVQDLVGPQNAPPTGGAYSRQDSSACSAQPTFLAVPINVNFIAINGGGTADGTAFKYIVKTDLLGPPSPSTTSNFIQPGETLFVVNWSPNSDSDTAGYDVYLDPAPGQAVVGSARTIGSGAACPSMVLTEVGSGSTSGTSSGVSSGAASGSSSSGGLSGIGSSGAASGAVASGVGGISTILPQYVVGANAVTGSTVSGLTTGSYTVTGLQNGVTYTVAVAAVDGSGNVGPPSTQACDYPALVSDFWRTYRKDGGGAGGGFCAFEAVGAPAGSTVAFVGLGAAAIALIRRRRVARR